MTTRRILVFGFSNVAASSGFSVPLIERMAVSHPQVEVVRVGLGALQPHVVPPFLRATHQTLGPFSDILLEINSSAFALHPLSTDALGRELLLDCVHTISELGARPAFLIHYRDTEGKAVLDFNGLTRSFCDEHGIAFVDLAEALVAEKGIDFVNGILKDNTHTTAQGSAFLADRVHLFLQDILSRDDGPALCHVPRPQWRREILDLPALMPDLPHETIECFNLGLSYACLGEGAKTTVEIGSGVRAMALSFLYHDGGGHVDVTTDPAGAPLRMTTIDPFSYFRRIGTLPFDFHRGLEFDSLTIGPIAAAGDVVLRKGQKSAPMRAYIGPLLTMRADSGA